MLRIDRIELQKERKIDLSCNFQTLKGVVLTSFATLLFNTHGYCQELKDIFLQFSGRSVTFRKTGENNAILYSAREDRLLTFKEELKAYPDTTYYLVKPRLLIFSAKQYESDLKPQVNIRVEYFYQGRNGKSTSIESWGKSYYPNTQKVSKVEDTRNTNRRITFVMGDESQWVFEMNKDGSTNVFYYKNITNPLLNYSLMFPGCQKEVENGVKL